tara:strand:- start:3476 stop:4126 length:651 start_codon:yes stop_codon:yes gene_type:complete
MKIGLLTYNLPHHKTQKVLEGLIKKGYKKIKLIFVPFKKYKKRSRPLITHRPKQFKGKSPQFYIKRYNLESGKIGQRNIFKGLDFVLICGSSLIKKKLLRNTPIINCHSGLIPQTRGLDSFKWAILNSHRVGNTLHYIDSRVDRGKVVYQEVTKLKKNDNIFQFARRHYDNEIKLLINFKKYLKHKKILKLKINPPRLRMPKNLERKVLLKFKSIK